MHVGLWQGVGRAVQTDYKMVALLCACPCAFFASFYSENLGKSVSNGEIASVRSHAASHLPNRPQPTALDRQLAQAKSGLDGARNGASAGHELHGCEAALLESST